MVSKYASAVLIVAALGLGTAAVASPNLGVQQDVGFITSIDLKDKTVTLSDGATFQLPAGYNINSLNEGQKVVVAWDQVGGTVLASRITFTN